MQELDRTNRGKKSINQLSRSPERSEELANIFPQKLSSRKIVKLHCDMLAAGAACSGRQEKPGLKDHKLSSTS